MAKSKINFGKLRRKMVRLQAKTLDDMARVALRHFKREVFEEKAWDGVSWKPRKDKKTHPLLQKSRKMKNSIRVLAKTKDSRIVGSDVRYAQYHNEGTPKMARRQFIGTSKELRNNFRKIVTGAFSKHL